MTAALLTGLVAGCAGTPVDNNGTSTPETGNTEAAAWPRTYVDASGTEVVLEAKPQKIDLLFFHHYEAVLALNAPLYAATDLEVYNGWESLKPYLEKTELIDLGGTREPNLEKLVEIEPDLIISAAGVHDEILDSLRKIAPTVVVSRKDNFGTWQGALREYGKILGEEALAEERITDLEAMISEARKTLSALSKPDSVSAGAVTSYEGFAEADPDYIFFYEDALNEEDEAIRKSLEESALWGSLNAVKLGHVYILDRSAFSGGPLAMELGVKTILNAMAPSE